MVTKTGCLPTLAILIASTGRASAQDACPIPLYGLWNLTFASKELTHEATLKMNGCEGIMDVAFYDRGRTVQISERMTERQVAWGIRLGGWAPVFKGTAIPADSIYAADNLYYAVSAHGDTSFTNCDVQNPPQCSPVRIVSSRKAIVVRLSNDCELPAAIAVLYKTPDDRWIRKAWFVVQPDGDAGFATLNQYVYLYAEGAGLSWTGEGKPTSLNRSVVDEPFEQDDSLPLYGTRSRTVSFLRVSIDPNQEVYIHRFACH